MVGVGVRGSGVMDPTGEEEGNPVLKLVDVVTTPKGCDLDLV